jgi:glycosyltransferase involved in cell wall biosynthesis
MTHEGGTADGGEIRPIVLLHVFSTFAVGGPQTRFATIADRLGGKYRHLIVSMSGNTEAAAMLSDRVSYELVPVRNTPANILGNIRRFSKQLRALKPDMLVTYNWGALEWAVGDRIGPHIPHVHIEDGFGPDESAKRFYRRVWLRRAGLKRTKFVVVPSRTLETIALTEWKLKRGQIVYLPNGVDIERFGAPVPVAERAFVRQPGELIVGTCAALRPEKNLTRLIRAFAACGARDARLVICGDGPERALLQATANEADLARRVVFTGHLARPELALAGFDVFAMSSDTEQMPYGLLEAMAAGLPVACTDVGDTASIVSEANRPFVVPAIDAAALTGALRTLLRQPDLRAKLGAANRAKVAREFSLETMIAGYDRLFSGG